jgi:hypothetical protein
VGKMSHQERASTEPDLIPEKTSIASCGWYMKRLKRFSAPLPGSPVCVAYERRVPLESDSCHSGHAPARGAIGPPGGAIGPPGGAIGPPGGAGQGYAERCWCAASAWPTGALAGLHRNSLRRGREGSPLCGGTPGFRRSGYGASGFLGSVYGYRVGTAGRGRLAHPLPDDWHGRKKGVCWAGGTWRQGEPWQSNGACREPRLSRCESMVIARGLLLATMCNFMTT